MLRASVLENKGVKITLKLLVNLKLKSSSEVPGSLDDYLQTPSSI
jgi:hypothetical protein